MATTQLKDSLKNNLSGSKVPTNYKNYITPDGYTRLMDEFTWLINIERPEITAIVSWAAGNGDRSENGDYIYGKKRLREIDRRIRFLTKRIDAAEIVNPTTPRADETQIFFGATVIFSDEKGKRECVSIVGVDEINAAKDGISWISPIAKALIKSRQGDAVSFLTPAGKKEIKILDVKYKKILIEQFIAPTK